MNAFDAAVRKAVCPRCGARPGARCVTTSGKPYGQDHQARTASARAAWDDGYKAGLSDAVSNPAMARRALARWGR